MAYINWSKIFQQFLVDETITYRDLAEKYHISHDYLKEVAGKNKWMEKRKVVHTLALNITAQRMNTEIAKRNEIHVSFAKALQSGAARALREGKLPTNPHDIATWITVGIKIERNVLQMDKPVGAKTEVAGHTGQKLNIFWGNGETLDAF